MKTLIISLTFLSVLFAQQNKIDSLESIVKEDNQNIEAMFELAKIYHDMVVVEENSEADERAEELLETILQKKQNHAYALAYFGSLLTLRGRDAIMPWNKLSYVEEGCDEMDKAIQLAPQDVRLRILRAMNNIKLPDFFNRKTYYLEDFAFIRNHPAFKSFAPGFQQTVLFNSAKAFENNDEREKSIEMYKRVIAINKDSDLGKKASKVISE